MDQKISGQKIIEIRNAFLESFSSEEELIMDLEGKFNNFEYGYFEYKQVIEGGTLEYKYFNLVKHFKERNQLKDLLSFAIEKRDKVPIFRDLMEELFPKEELEFLLKPPINSNLLEAWENLQLLLEPISLSTIVEVFKTTLAQLNDLDGRAIYSDFFARFERLRNSQSLENGQFRLEMIDELKSCLLERPPQNHPNLIFGFVEYLIDSIDDKIKLSNWLEKETKKRQVNLPIYQKETVFQPQLCYLVIFVEPKGNDKYFLKSSLFHKKEDLLDTIEATKQDLFDKIAELIRISKIQHIKNKYSSYELFIEFYITIDYINSKLEAKEIQVGLGRTSPINCEYPINLRCYERLNEFEGEYKNKIALKWDKWKALHYQQEVDYQDFILYEKTESINWEKIRVDWSQKNMLMGINVIGGLPEIKEVNLDLFISLLRSGIPICLWSKGEDISNIIWKEEIKKLVCRNSINDLNQLFKTVHNLCSQTYAIREEAKQYCGYPFQLGLLCDHLDRIPKILQEQLRS